VKTGVSTLNAELDAGPQRKARRAVQRNVTSISVSRFYNPTPGTRRRGERKKGPNIAQEVKNINKRRKN